MTDCKQLHHLKTVAKRFARAHRIPHHQALDLIALHLGHSHWNALNGAWDKGWRPSPSQLEAIDRISEETPAASRSDEAGKMPFFAYAQEEHGTIDGHPYTLSVAFEVFMYGTGWGILLEHAPSEAPQVEIAAGSEEGNPILDPEFKAKALKIAHVAAEKLRERIAADWPRRSSKPDGEGRAQHPLFKQLSAKWHCLHCDAVSSGAEMAANMWHCPKCSATPIDIHAANFWHCEF